MRPLLQALIVTMLAAPVALSAGVDVPVKPALSFPVSFVETDEHSYYFMKVGDLDGDGLLDYLLARGAVQQEAFRHDGTLLWRHQDPAAFVADLHPESDFRIYDIDGDGANEAVLGRLVDGRLHLCIVDGKTGEVEKSVPFPGAARRKSNRAGMVIANIRGLPAPKDIVLSWDQEYVAAVDDRLGVLWEGPAGLGQRTPKAADTDADGRDEILCSATLLDDDGSVLWSRRDLPAMRSRNSGRFEKASVDSPHIVNLDGDSADGLEIILSAGAWALDSRGKALWGLGEQVVFGHHADVARVWPGTSGAGILIVDWADRGMTGGNRTVRLLDARGKVRWQKPAEWAIFGDWTGDGMSEVFLGSGKIVNAEGKPLATVPGFFSNAMVADVVGDSRDELITVRTDAETRSAYLDVYAGSPLPENTKKTSVPLRTLNWSCY